MKVELKELMLLLQEEEHPEGKKYLQDCIEQKVRFHEPTLRVVRDLGYKGQMKYIIENNIIPEVDL